MLKTRGIPIKNDDMELKSMNTLKLEEMTWMDIWEKIDNGFDTVIIPIAAIEQHGPHLPLNTDVLLGEAMAEQTAQRLGNALVAPAVRPGCSDHHLDFAGSLSISEELMDKIICEYCKCYEKHGFKVIVLLPSHGGNFIPVQKTSERLKREYEPKGIKIVPLADLERLVRLSCKALIPYGFTPQQVGWHAGAGETTGVMALRPELVKEDRFVEGYTGNELEFMKLMVGGMKAVSSNGILGDPRGSTAEMGKKLLECVADDYAELIRKA